MRGWVDDMSGVRMHVKKNDDATPKRCRKGQRWIVKLTSSMRGKLRSVCVIVGAATVLSGCAGGVCTGWGVVHSRPGDQFTDATAREILKNNEYGYALHCPAFKPRGR